MDYTIIAEREPNKKTGELKAPSEARAKKYRKALISKNAQYTEVYVPAEVDSLPPPLTAALPPGVFNRYSSHTGLYVFIGGGRL